MQKYALHLRPLFSDTGSAEAIAVQTRFTFVSRKQKDAPLFRQVLSRGPVKNVPYDSQAVTIVDSASGQTVHTCFRDSPDNRERTWHLHQDAAPPQELTATYTALPRVVDQGTKCGPQIALEREATGMSGAGMGFLLIFATEDDAATVELSIEWDLGAAPEGTRAVCTFGENVRIEVKEKASNIPEIFFAFGPDLKSYPPSPFASDLASVERDQSFGLYWIDEPPFNVTSLGEQISNAFRLMAEFFQDSDQRFRIFIRHNAYKCASGRGLYRGFVFAWTKLIPPTEDERLEFLFHEIVHNWPRLALDKPISSAKPEDFKDGWWNEGIAEYYSLILPYRFGIFDESDFVKRLNRRISSYYTNPERDVVNKDVYALFYDPNRPLVNRVFYQRGFMFFLKLAYQLDHANGRSLDDLVLDMVKRARDSRPFDIKVWLELVAAELGPSSVGEYEDMANAKTIFLPSDLMASVMRKSPRISEAADYQLVRADHYEFYLGFPAACLTSKPRVIKDLDLDCRGAVEGGVREGDRVTPLYSVFYVAERYDQTFEMTAIRENEADTGNGKDEFVRLEWWPRSRKTVECWQVSLIE